MITHSAQEYDVLESGKQLIEAGWAFEFVVVYHHHFGSTQAEHGRLGCMMLAAIWLWIGLLRDTQAGANLQKTLPACLRTRVACSSILWLVVRAAFVLMQSCGTFKNTTCSTYVHSMPGMSPRALNSPAIWSHECKNRN